MKKKIVVAMLSLVMALATLLSACTATTNEALKNLMNDPNFAASMQNLKMKLTTDMSMQIMGEEESFSDTSIVEIDNNKYHVYSESIAENNVYLSVENGTLYEYREGTISGLWTKHSYGMEIGDYISLPNEMLEFDASMYEYKNGCFNLKKSAIDEILNSDTFSEILGYITGGMPGMEDEPTELEAILELMNIKLEQRIFTAGTPARITNINTLIGVEMDMADMFSEEMLELMFGEDGIEDFLIKYEVAINMELSAYGEINITLPNTPVLEDSYRGEGLIAIDIDELPVFGNMLLELKNDNTFVVTTYTLDGSDELVYAIYSGTYEVAEDFIYYAEIELTIERQHFAGDDEVLGTSDDVFEEFGDVIVLAAEYDNYASMFIEWNIDSLGSNIILSRVI